MLLMSNPLSVMVFSVLEGMYSFPRLVVQFMLLGEAFPVLYMWLKKKKAWACKTLFIKIKMRVCMEFLVTSLWSIASSLWKVELFVQGLPTWAFLWSWNSRARSSVKLFAGIMLDCRQDFWVGLQDSRASFSLKNGSVVLLPLSSVKGENYSNTTMLLR